MHQDTVTEIRRLLDALALTRPGFRRREAQDRMIRAVAETLDAPGDDGGRICVVEAPTGVGKSLAYLVAGLAVARQRGKRLVVATATVALQSQLRDDADLLSRPDGQPLRVTVLKGRGRYLCDRNLADLHGQGGDQTTMDFGNGDAPADAWPFQPKPAERSAVEKLWDARRHGGWNGDMDVAPVEASQRLRPLLSTTSSGCAGEACRWVASCPVFKARKDSGGADLTITNHAMLLADTRHSGAGLLPPPERTILIVDEAHGLESSAIESTAVGVRIDKELTTAKELVAALKRAAGHVGGSVTSGQQVKILAATQAVSAGLAQLRLLLTASNPDIGTNGALARVYGQPLVRAISVEGLTDTSALAISAKASRSLSSLLDRGRRKLVSDGSGTGAAAAAGKSARELGMLSDQLGDAGATLDRVTREGEGHDGPPAALWVERDGQGRVVLRASEISAASWLRSRLWDRLWGATLTSATLGSMGEMGTFLRGVGLDRFPGVRVGTLPSPFDLATAAVLEVPPMIAEPSNRDAFAAECASLIGERLDAREGTLIVCASRDLLNNLLSCLDPAVRSQIRVQGDAPLASLLDAHASDIRAGKGAILAGLATLAEGINLPGDQCTHVVIVQVPFARIDHPLTAKRAEWLDRLGVGSFNGMLLPDAHRRLTQTCGRLIRTETDRGRITVLDGRLLTKKYGKRMLDTLPPYRKVVGH